MKAITGIIIAAAAFLLLNRKSIKRIPIESGEQNNTVDYETEELPAPLSFAADWDVPTFPRQNVYSSKGYLSVTNKTDKQINTTIEVFFGDTVMTQDGKTIPLQVNEITDCATISFGNGDAKTVQIPANTTLRLDVVVEFVDASGVLFPFRATKPYMFEFYTGYSVNGIDFSDVIKSTIPQNRSGSNLILNVDNTYDLADTEESDTEEADTEEYVNPISISDFQFTSVSEPVTGIVLGFYGTFKINNLSNIPKNVNVHVALPDEIENQEGQLVSLSEYPNAAKVLLYENTKSYKGAKSFMVELDALENHTFKFWYELNNAQGVRMWESKAVNVPVQFNIIYSVDGIDYTVYVSRRTGTKK